MTDLKIPTDTPSILSKLLPHFGVKKVFVSPGSRNATIVDALVQNKELNAEWNRNYHFEKRSCRNG